MNSSWSLDVVRRHLASLLPRLRAAPRGVVWRNVRPRRAQPVRAELALSTGEIATSRGMLRHEAGKHYIVHRAPGERIPVPRAVFERLYRRRGDGRYEQRLDVVLRYFTLTHPVFIETNEGSELAHPGDWIMQGDGHLWAISAAEAEDNYEPA